MLRFSFFMSAMIQFSGLTFSAETDPVAKYRQAAIARWEADIRELEQLDRTQVDPQDAILFTGSSSIRRWTSIERDMAPWPAIRRGYGGAQFSDLAVFIERIVKPHPYRALVIFVGNDISGKAEDKSPEEVLEIYRYLIKRVRESHPDEPIFCIAVTPTPSRISVWPQVQKMHALFKEFISKDEKLYFIETAYAFLDADGQPKGELFVEDRLHLNEEGYKVWAGIIKTELEKVLAKPAG